MTDSFDLVPIRILVCLAVLLAGACAPLRTPGPAIASPTAISTVTASPTPALTAVPPQAPPDEGAAEDILGLPLESMTYEEIEAVLTALTREEVSALWEDVFTLRNPDSEEEVSVRALRFARLLRVEDAGIAEVRHTTLGEVRDVVNMPVENPEAPVWYIEVSG